MKEPLKMSEGIIFVRDYGDTHIARFRGKRASCTSSRRAAAESVARKVMGDKPHSVEMCGNEFSWQVVSLITNNGGEGRPASGRTSPPLGSQEIGP